jgi:hypothetical protein
MNISNSFKLIRKNDPQGRRMFLSIINNRIYFKFNLL